MKLLNKKHHCMLGFGSEYQKYYCPYGVTKQAECPVHCGYLYIRTDGSESDMPIYKALYAAIFGETRN